MNYTIALKLCRAIFLIFLIFFAGVIALYHFRLVTYPYPAALREAAFMASTAALVHGANPYSFALQPQFVNSYGIVYPLCVWPLAKIGGVTLFVHRLVSAVFILLSLGLVYAVMQKKGTPFLLKWWAVLMLYASLVFPQTVTPCVEPSATGLFFMLLTVFLPFLLDYSYPSLIVSAVCAVLAFYTKAYFFLGAVMLGPYLFLFISKRKALGFGFVTGGLLAASIPWINKLLPAYFNNCFFINYNYKDKWLNDQRLHEQLAAFGHLHAAVFVLMAGIVCWHLVRRKWKFSFSLDLYAAIFTGALLVLFLGKNSGAWLWYFFQLFSPFMVIVAAGLVASLSLWPLIAVPFLVFNLYALTADEKFQGHEDEWAHVDNILRTKQYIYSSSLIAPLLIQGDREFFDDGQTEYFMEGQKRLGLWKRLVKEDDRVEKAMVLYLLKLDAMVTQHRFGIIMINGVPPVIQKQVDRFYKYMGVFSIWAPQDQKRYYMKVWVPA
jgi:hypothetical protein